MFKGTSDITKELKEFSWEFVINDLSWFAPTLKQVLVSATKTRSPGICSAILVKHRNPELNLVQKLVAMILYDGHCFKKGNYTHVYII